MSDLFTAADCRNLARNIVDKDAPHLDSDTRQSLLNEFGAALLDMQARGTSRSLRNGIQAAQEMVHGISRSKGWYEGRERQPLEFLMLIVSEIAEACEEVRKGTPACYYEGGNGERIEFPLHRLDDFNAADLKPEGELIELADAAIRIMDYCAARGWSLADAIVAKSLYNETRPQRHGGKLL